ncbi:MAG: helix-turn-helix domain-containing protein [Acidobacteriaceae bacterium]
MAGTTRRKVAATEFPRPEPAASQPRAREVMDIRQAAEYLGISPDSLYKYASENFIPAFKLGNRWRFKRSLLESWMEQQSSRQLSPVRGKSPGPKQKKPAGMVR